MSAGLTGPQDISIQFSGKISPRFGNGLRSLPPGHISYVCPALSNSMRGKLSVDLVEFVFLWPALKLTLKL